MMLCGNKGGMFSFFFFVKTFEFVSYKKGILQLVLLPTKFLWQLSKMEDKCFTWKGKWSGPRAGAELIWTVPVSIASLISIALLMSLVKTHPCVIHRIKQRNENFSALEWINGVFDWEHTQDYAVTL